MKYQDFIKLKVNNDIIKDVLQGLVFIKIDNESYLSVKDHKNLETLCVHFITSVFIETNLNSYLHKCNRYIKKNYDCANAKSITEKHWAININIFAFNTICTKNIFEFFAKKQEKNFEIGKLKALIDLSSNSLYIPEYKGEKINYFSLKNYEKICRFIKKIFQN